MKNRLFKISALVCAALLASCGGGDGGLTPAGNTPVVPTSPAAPTSPVTVTATAYPSDAQLPVGWQNIVPKDFAGSYRKTAKTSHFNVGGAFAPADVYLTPGELIAALKASAADQVMRAKYTTIGDTTANDLPRQPEEQRNVVVTGYLRAVKWENAEDQDMHVALCDTPLTGIDDCITTEVSGLPLLGTQGYADVAVFEGVRRQLVGILGQTTGYAGGFLHLANPPRVEVAGSLFFDGAHAAGVVGPLKSRSITTWEVHPIYNIRKLP